MVPLNQNLHMYGCNINKQFLAYRYFCRFHFIARVSHATGPKYKFNSIAVFEFLFIVYPLTSIFYFYLFIYLFFIHMLAFRL